MDIFNYKKSVQVLNCLCVIKVKLLIIWNFLNLKKSFKIIKWVV